jgi:hypothetical protein
MHIQLIVDQQQGHAIEEIRRINAVMVQLGYEGRTVFAEAYGADGLVQILEVRACGGQSEIFVMECSREQVQAVLEWQSCNDAGEFENLVIHLVRKA